MVISDYNKHGNKCVSFINIEKSYTYIVHQLNSSHLDTISLMTIMTHCGLIMYNVHYSIY